MNRFAIDEDAAHEVVGVYYLHQSSSELCDPKNEAYANYEIERQQKEHFDNKVFQKGIQRSAKNQSSGVQNHIFATGLPQTFQTFKRKQHILNLIRHYKITSIVSTELLVYRIRVSTLEMVKSAYKDDQGIILANPKYLSTKEGQVRFELPDWSRAHHFENLFQRNVVVGMPFEHHIQSSLLNDIDELFETASTSTVKDPIKNDKNYHYSFLFQKLTLDELKLVQRKEPNQLDRFVRYSGRFSNNFNIDEMEMKNSQSESRYASLYSVRVTSILEGSSHRNQRLLYGRAKKNRRSNKKWNKKRRKR